MGGDQMDTDENGVAIAQQKCGTTKKKVYVPGISRTLKTDEELVYDAKAYLLFHAFETDYPCLSFDVLSDSLGDNRSNFPMTAWLAAGTQAEHAKDNELLVEAKRGGHKEEAEESSSSEEDDAEEGGGKAARMHAALIPHYGGINRIKCQTLGSSNVCAVWNDQQKVQLWNMNSSIECVNGIGEETPSKLHKIEKDIVKESLLFSFPGHSAEGFALAWSPTRSGTLASGDLHSKIFLWRMSEGGQWLIDQRPLTEHQSSVEDLAWSPTEEALLMSCSADHTIRLWDVRASHKESCVCTVKDAHDGDVNVISWNNGEPLIVSGGDDTVLRVWSLKTIQYNQSVAQFRHHQKPISSVEWSPHDATVFMASGEDDQTTLWDLALEEDELSGDVEEGGGEKQLPKVPSQLLFIHMGQKEVKEVHWHKQCPGLAFTTALDGFHVFKTINV
uniref:Glutamate-rich WD repeat-containing protein 1 n=1 Tax=Globodera rostochiensis TaxID=31243 RepID=A0A914GTN2_GLORO